MISELYQKVLENELGRARYLLLLMIVGTLQILKQAKLEILAEALPIPILFESRRKKLKRFLKLEILKIERIWFPCLNVKTAGEIHNKRISIYVHRPDELGSN